VGAIGAFDFAKRSQELAVVWIKVVTKVPGNAAESQRRRELVRPLIGTYGGKDVSPGRRGAKFTAAVFSTVKAAKAFHDSAPRALRLAAVMLPDALMKTLLRLPA
jgi:hypothetical protein